MKNWFISLDEKKRTNVIIISWAVSGLTLLLSAVAIIFSYVFVASLIVSILFTKWRNLGAGQTNTSASSAVSKYAYTPLVETEEEKERKRRRQEEREGGNGRG